MAAESQNIVTYSRHIPDEIKKEILRIQDYKCANRPDRPATNLKDYPCLLWQSNNGNFDEASYQYDHINEYSLSKDSSAQNIQALCPNCHAVKTRRFMRNKGVHTSTEMHFGACMMDIVIEPKKKKNQPLKQVKSIKKNQPLKPVKSIKKNQILKPVKSIKKNQILNPVKSIKKKQTVKRPRKYAPLDLSDSDYVDSDDDDSDDSDYVNGNDSDYGDDDDDDVIIVE